MKNLLLLISFFFMHIGAAADPADKKLTDYFKDKTKIENPFELRDPFKSPPSKADREKGVYHQEGKGNYTNIKSKPVHDLNIYELKVVGVLIGRERRAIINPTATSKDVIIVKEGMKLGPDQAELKAILPGGILLVEKIINVYGQEEYLETVIPISR